MTEDSQTPQFRRLSRQIELQRYALCAERLWPVLHWPLMVLGVAFTFIASGLLGQFAPLWRAGFWFGFAVALVFSLRGFLRWRQVRRLEAMRHLELSSSISHRGLSSVEDEIAAELNDPEAWSVWELHKQRQLQNLGDVAVAPPKSLWRNFDPRALRVAVFLSAFVALMLGTGDVVGNLGNALRFTPAQQTVALNIDAWLKPPAYTGRPPLLLTSPGMLEKVKSGGVIEVPMRSIFTVRISGADAPVLRLEGSAAAEVKGAGTAGTLEQELTLEANTTIVAMDGDTELARWPIALLADLPPKISLTAQPAAEGQGNLIIAWAADDDFGLRQLAANLDLADEQEGGLGFESNGIFLYDAPELKMSLRRPNAKSEDAKTRFNLASHAWAGFKVTLSLSVDDAAGQQGSITPVTFKMPEREFSKSLSRALIEQRKQLILFPERAGHVGTLLDTAMLYPKGLFERSGYLVAISAIASRLRNAAGYDDVKLAVDGLWDVAVAIEDGVLTDAKAELQALRKELEKALRDGASKERIAELMEKMRGAMDRLLEAMRKEAEQRMKDGTLDPNGQSQGKMLSKEDLDKMLNELEDMAKNGSKDAAQQMLAELDRLLQSLEPGAAQQGGGEGDQELENMMKELGEMMRRQQKLMDETQRRPGDDDQQGDEPGQGQQPGQGSGALADRQGDLRGALDKLRGRGSSGELDDLGGASGDMQGAEGALRESDKDGALRQQGDALNKLRKGAQNLAKKLREQDQGQAGAEARDGEGADGKDDPLGRPRASRNPDTGPKDDMLPSEQAMRRAREILETLRAKANDRGLTDAERSYIDRLLRGLY